MKNDWKNLNTNLLTIKIEMVDSTRRNENIGKYNSAEL